MLTISFSDIYASSISEILTYDNPRMLRIVLKTHGDISYTILSNKEDSKVTVVFENAVELSPIVLSTLQPVKKMAKISTTQDEKGGIISLHFLLNSSFYNVKSFSLFSPPSIIIDIADTAPGERSSTSMDSAEKKDSSGQDVNKLTKARPNLQNLLLQKSSASTKGLPDIDLFPSDLLNLKDGVVRAIYKDYMKQKFDKIFKDGKTFLKRHPNSQAADEVAFLIAESRYQQQKENGEINLLPTVEAFHYAIEQNPDSSFVSYGYFMIGKCYYEMDWIEEVLAHTQKALDSSEPGARHLSVLNYYHAHALAETKKYNAAVAGLLDLLGDPALSNLSSEIRYRLATVYAGKGEWEKSL